MNIKDWDNCETYRDYTERKECEDRQDRRLAAGVLFVVFLLALGAASATWG